MRKILFAIAILSCFCFAECKKNKHRPPPDNPYGLPNASQEGKDIFACRVNGENWISEKGLYNIGGGVSDDSLYVRGTNHERGVERIYLLINDIIQEDTAYMIDGINKITFTTTKLCGTEIINFYSYEAHGGEIRISKIDRTNRVISGTFFFNVIRNNCSSDTLHFTDGRFDIRFN